MAGVVQDLLLPPAELSPEERKQQALEAEKEERLKNADLARYVKVLTKMKVPIL